jgi:WD40 repeat protein
VHAISFHPNGRLLATGCDDHSARIWSLDSGDQLGEPFWLNGRATAVRYTDRGNALLVGGIEDTEVNCYNTTTRRGLFLPLPHPEGVTHVAASADGSLIGTVATDGIGRLWRIPSASIPPPRWLRDYLSALSGTMFSTEQQFTQVATRERVALRKALLNQPRENSVWDTITRWSFERTASRASDPWSHGDK